MRKNSPRKWLHACLDLLPVILIPVFMIYSHRHDVSSTSTYTEQVPVYYESNEVESVDDIGINKVYFWDDNFTFDSSLANKQFGHVLPLEEYTILNSNFNLTDTIVMYTGTAALVLQQSGNLIIMHTNTFNVVFLDFNYNNLSLIWEHFSFSNSSILREYTTITHDFEKDVMGAFMSNFNFTIDKYFNMGNVFNLTGVYDWFNTNIFNGNAPQIIYSIWNIALYELVMDLLFLLYGLFMWFIDMVEHLMEKPFKSIK